MSPALHRVPPLGELLDHAVERWADREALVFSERRFTFAELAADVDRVARALLHVEVGAGEHVAVWLPNRPEWVHLFFAVAKIGAVLVPIHTRFRTVDLEYVLRDSDACTLVAVDRAADVDYVGMVRELVPEVDRGVHPFRSARFPSLRQVIVIGDDVPRGAMAWATLLAGGDVARREAPARLADADTPTLVLYTSGTTGVPKGAVHTHVMSRTVEDGASRLGLTGRDVLLMFLPLFHSMGIFGGPLLLVVTGARLVLMERFDAGDALRLIARERVTYFSAFDTHFVDLLGHPDLASTDRSGLRLAFLPAGAPSVEPVARRVNRALCRTVSGYGSTEVGTGVCFSFLDASEDERCLGSGYPVPGYELRVIHPSTGEPVGPGVPGELLVRGYGVMRGYYRRPAETALAIDPLGWFHTGDLATVDAEGFVRFLGRVRDTLKVGGENVDPAEVEAFLLHHPAVAQVKIVGIPDLRLGEVPVACVIGTPGQSVAEEELIAFCRGRIASFKIPRRVVFVSEYPLTSSGKVQRFALRDRVLAVLG
jgi:fatty-acyl-CoA synthase